MTPAGTAFASRTIAAFTGLATLAVDQLEAAALAVEAGDLDQAVDQLRAASDLARQAGAGAFCLAGTLDAERRKP
jgi:ABC-type amino acid transport substrate-binding protein